MLGYRFFFYSHFSLDRAETEELKQSVYCDTEPYISNSGLISTFYKERKQTKTANKQKQDDPAISELNSLDIIMKTAKKNLEKMCSVVLTISFNRN